jgi:GDP-4-dehydro-6-deoxy-D-mannose reductase
MLRPDVLIHLSSYSSVAYSWKYPIDAIKNNTNIFLNLLEALRAHASSCRVLSIGSSEEYGIVSENQTPLREHQPLRPASPYAVARVAQEDLSRVYCAGFGMDVVCTRSFNQVGPGQSDRFVVSAIARQFAELVSGRTTSITTGDIGIVRDFLDVRDAVRAYRLLLKKGVAGEVYNVCSGRGYAIGAVVSMLMEITGTKPPMSVDRSLLRPVENRIVVGSYEKLAASTGWQPEIEFARTLQDILEYWLEAARAAPGTES